MSVLGKLGIGLGLGVLMMAANLVLMSRHAPTWTYFATVITYVIGANALIRMLGRRKR